MPGLYSVRLIAKREPVKGHHHFVMYAPDIAANALPGQFLQIKCSKGIDPLLRRPISLLRANEGDGTIEVLFRVSGRGTELLSQRNIGEEIDVLGPLGNSFSIPGSGDKKEVAIIAGGIGAAPVVWAAEAARRAGSRVSFFGGFQSSKAMIGLPELNPALGIETRVATDDGSSGYKGFVTGLFRETLDSGWRPDIVFACGPRPMLAAAANICSDYGLKCEVSLEERMACGVGACLGCTCKTRKNGSWEHSRVCTEGPVFDSAEVIFGD